MGQMNTIYVTGGSGFLGRRIVAALADRGLNVLAPRSAEVNLETGAGLDAFFEAQKGQGTPVDAVIHSAAYYGGIGINQTDPAGLISRNTAMTTAVWTAAVRHGLRKVVSVGSSCAYPGALSGLLEEKDMFSGRCHDSVEAYGYNKRLHLVFGRAYHRQHGIDFNQLALTNLYGEGDVFTEGRSHAISAMIKKFADAKLALTGAPVLWGTGEPLREFCHVDDAAFVIAEALDWETDLEAVNVCGEEIRIRDLATLIAELTEYDGDVVWDRDRPDGVARKALSDAKLKTRVSAAYRPRSLRDGLAGTIRWYLANKEVADARG